MKFKKITAAVLSAAVCAGMLSGMAITASAADTAKVNTDLSYCKDGSALTEYQYAVSESVTYTLSDTDAAAIAAAKSGDTLTISYDITATKALRYRSTMELAGEEFHVNALASSTTGEISQSATSGVHVNTPFSEENNKVSVTYVVNFGENGAISSIDVSATGAFTGSGNYTQIKTNSGAFDSTKISSVTLKAVDRNNSDAAECAKLTNFKAVLTTAASDLAAVASYTGYTIDQTLEKQDAKGFTADFTVDQGKTVTGLTWYITDKNHDYYKKLDVTGELPTISSNNGGAQVKVGLVLYDIPNIVDADSLAAGYTVTIE